MKKLLNINQIDEFPFIKRKKEKQLTEKISKRKSSVSISKQKKIDKLRNGRKSLFEPEIIKPVSITFKKFPQILNLIKYIKLIKEMKTKKNNLEQNNDTINNIINKIVELLKLNKGWYNFFCFYQINEKAILRMARGLHFLQRGKNDYIYLENDSSNKIYFLLKGKVSFRQYFNTESEREISQLSENNIFGMSDIIYDRKRKLSCIALEECSYLCFSKDIFKLYMEENVNKVISERKRFLFKFYQDYLPISPVKIDHYISNATENLFFRKNDVIYKEGNKNISLFLIFKGEANLAININKNEFDVLPNFKLSAKKLKENARKIEFNEIIDNCKNEMTKLGGENNLNTLDLNDYKIISTLGKGNICGMEISSGLTNFKYNLICNSDFCIIFRIKLEHIDNGHLKTLMANLLPNFINKEKKIHRLIKNVIFMDHYINPPSCQKYNIKRAPILINNDCKPAKTQPSIKTQKKEIINIDINKTISTRNKNVNTTPSMKMIQNKTENNISLAKRNEKKFFHNLCISVNENESNKEYMNLIKKIDDRLDTNEGGFIKLTDYNLNLLKHKNYIKLQLKNNKMLDFKIKNFIKKCEEKEKNNLKTSTVKMNYSLNEDSFKNQNENSYFGNNNLGFLVHPHKRRIKTGNKPKAKIWSFPLIKPFETKSQTFMGFYNNNFKIKLSKKSDKRKKLKMEMEDMMEKYEKDYTIRESKKNLKEIYDKLVSFRLLSKEEKSKKKSTDLKHGNFIKELIIMKKLPFQDEITDTKDDQDLINKTSYKNIQTDINNKKDSIKILNLKYLDDMFYNNLKSFKNTLINDHKDRSNNLFNQYYYNKFRNYHKNKMILYNTGKFDMPLASNISINEKK